MERMASPEQRLSQLAQRLEVGFGQIDARFSRLEAQMETGFDRVDRDIHELRADFRHQNDLILRLGGRIMMALVGVILALLGVIGAVLASG